jgi:hypothetical protein
MLGQVVHPHPSQWRELALREGMALTFAGARAGNFQIVSPSLRESLLAPARTKESSTSIILATIVGDSRPKLPTIDKAANCT